MPHFSLGDRFRRMGLTVLAAVSVGLAAEPGGVSVAGFDARGNKIADGAGFFVTAGGEAVVSRRVLVGAARAEIRTADGQRYRVGSVLADSLHAGLARVSVDPPLKDVPFVALVEAEPAPGESLSIAGSPAGVKAVRNVPGFGPVFRLAGVVPPGNFGRLVVNSKGAFIGVVLWSTTEPAEMTLAGSAETVHYMKPGSPKTLAEWNKLARESSPFEEAYRDGLNRLFLDDLDAALSRFESVLEKDPRFAEAWFHAGFVQGKLGHQKKKIDAYREAVRLRPDFAAVHYSLGVSYALMGESQLAVEEFKALEKLDSELAEKLEILLEALGHQGHEHGQEDSPKPPPKEV